METKKYVSLTDIIYSKNKISVITSDSNCEIDFEDEINKILDIGVKSSVNELKNVLTQNKLVIIQYPENSSHPLTTVKNVETIVDLIKEVDCKIIITTYSFDLINAIEYYSKMKNLDVSFYFCEYDDKDSITFLNCGNDINTIFKSFNLALDRVNSYS